MTSYIEEIISAFDKAYPKGGSTQSSAATNNIFMIKEDSNKLIQNKLWNSTIWWQRLYMPPNGQDRIPAQSYIYIYLQGD